MAAQHVGGKIDRKSVTIVQGEGDLAGELVAAGVGYRFIEHAHAALQQIEKALLLGGNRRDNQRARRGQFGIMPLHAIDHRLDQGYQKRRIRPERIRMPHGAPQNPAQNVPAALVVWGDPIGNEECACPRMIRQHLETGFVCWGELCADELLGELHEAAEQIGVVVVGSPLHHRGDAL